MPVSRMRMRPWLEKMIDSNSILGLTWVDKDKMMFSIPWKHAARHGWELEKDASLFKMWAIHTGKYTEGQTSDPKTWKANFRCAMNSLPDIEEVKDRSIHKGQQAVRVFKMLHVSPKLNKRSKAKNRKQRKGIKTEEDTDYSDTQSPTSTDEESTQENTVDSTVKIQVSDLELGFYDPLPDNFCLRFQVSPEHSTDYSDSNDIIEICKQLEEGAQFMPSSSDFMEFLSNEDTSPERHWSDTSSADESDRSPCYTTLSSDLSKDNSLWDPLMLPSVSLF